MDIYFHIFLSRWIACADVATRNTFLMDKSMSGQTLPQCAKNSKCSFQKVSPPHPPNHIPDERSCISTNLNPPSFVVSNFEEKFFWASSKMFCCLKFWKLFWAYSKMFCCLKCQIRNSSVMLVSDTQWVVVVYKLRHSFYNLGLTIDWLWQSINKSIPDWRVFKIDIGAPPFPFCLLTCLWILRYDFYMPQFGGMRTPQHWGIFFSLIVAIWPNVCWEDEAVW